MTLKKILFASDLSERAGRAGRRTAQLAADNGSQVDAVHVIEDRFPEPGAMGLPADVPDPTEQVRRNAEQALQQSVPGHQANIRVVFGDVVGELVEAADAEESDLVVVGAHGQQYVLDWVVGTTAEQLVRYSTRPTLVVRREPEGAYRRIVVATDFSSCADAALRCAAEWFGVDALKLVHVVDTGPLEQMQAAGVDPRFVERHYERQRSRARDELEQAVVRLGLDTARTKREQLAGHPASALERLVEAESPDLVVIGNHGRGRWSDMLLGSVAARLLHGLDTDVLCVRD